MKPAPLLKLILPPVLFGAALLAVWWAVSASQRIQAFMLPSPAQVWAAAQAERATLWAAFANTARATLIAFPVAVVVSAALAVVLSLSAIIRACLFPYLMILQMTPIIVITPVLLLWFGAGDISVVLITFLISFFPLVVNTTQGLLSTDRHLLDLFQMYKASRWQQLVLLRVPAASPYFFTGMRISAILAPIGAVTGDFFAGNSGNGVGGLGFQVVMYSAQFKTAALFATAGACCVLGFLLYLLTTSLERLCLRHWHDSYREKRAVNSGRRAERP